jgi:hypothetical protein
VRSGLSGGDDPHRGDGLLGPDVFVGAITVFSSDLIIGIPHSVRA